MFKRVQTTVQVSIPRSGADGAGGVGGKDDKQAAILF